MNGDFSRFGLEHKTFDADDIADVEFFERLIFVNAHIVAAEIALHSAVAVHDMTETCLAHNAFGHKSARNRHDLTFKLVVVCKNFAGSGGAVV